MGFETVQIVYSPVCHSLAVLYRAFFFFLLIFFKSQILVWVKFFWSTRGIQAVCMRLSSLTTSPSFCFRPRQKGTPSWLHRHQQCLTVQLIRHIILELVLHWFSPIIKIGIFSDITFLWFFKDAKKYGYNRKAIWSWWARNCFAN